METALWLKKSLKTVSSTLYGTDASVQGITIARTVTKNRFFVQDLSSNELPRELQDIPFKTIISIEVIEHLYNPDELIAFCKKILIKSGAES